MTTIETPKHRIDWQWWQAPKSLIRQRYNDDNCMVRDVGPHALECVSNRVDVEGTELLPLRHKHQFALVQRAHTYPDSTNPRIDVQDWVEYYVDGVQVERFRWGHGIMGIYETVRIESNHMGLHGGLLGSHVLGHDLPCCGGTIRVDREHVGLSTLQECTCTGCGAKWEIGDGHNFKRARV